MQVFKLIDCLESFQNRKYLHYCCPINVFYRHGKFPFPHTPNLLQFDSITCLRESIAQISSEQFYEADVGSVRFSIFQFGLFDSPILLYNRRYWRVHAEARWNSIFLNHWFSICLLQGNLLVTMKRDRFSVSSLKMVSRNMSLCRNTDWSEMNVFHLMYSILLVWWKSVNFIYNPITWLHLRTLFWNYLEFGQLNSFVF